MKISSQENILDIAEYFAEEVWNKKNLQVLDECLHQNLVVHSLLGDFIGSNALKEVIQLWLKGFPDLTITNSAIICDRDLVAIQWDAKGTHLGEFKGITPSYKPVSYRGMTVYRIHECKIIEYWAYLDMQHLLNQLK